METFSDTNWGLLQPMIDFLTEKRYYITKNPDRKEDYKKITMELYPYCRKKLPRKLKKKIFGSKKDRLKYIPEYYKSKKYGK